MSQEKPRNLYIISTSDEPNNVIFGHASFAKAAGFEPVFVFPRRPSSQDFSAFYSDYKTIRLNFTFAANNVFFYLRSVILLIIFVTGNFLFQRQAKHFLAIDLVGTVACLFLKLRGVGIHTLVNDNFSASYDISPKQYAVLRAIESNILRFISRSCIFPDKSRYVLLGSPNIKQLYFIPNILTDAYAPAYEGSNSDKLIVMFCGWLVDSRGIELLPNILEHTLDNVEFLLVGSGDEATLNFLSAKKRIKYMGHVSRDTNLDLMAKADINVAFYSPRILINRFALPQKIYDSLMIGCPLFVNSEVEMSVALLKSGSCFTAEYFDVPTICRKLNELAKDKKPLKEVSSAMADFCAKHANYKHAQLIGQNIYKEILSLQL
jgi:glycosyltransferase involved in cell wall biosynthesis